MRAPMGCDRGGQLRSTNFVMRLIALEREKPLAHGVRALARVSLYTGCLTALRCKPYVDHSGVLVWPSLWLVS